MNNNPINLNNNLLKNLSKNKVNKMNFEELLNCIYNLINSEERNINSFEKNINLLFMRLMEFIKINKKFQITNKNNSLNGNIIIIQFIINKDEIEMNSNLVFELNWGTEKKFNDYLNILIDELGLGTFNNFKNRNKILNNILEEIKTNNSNVNIQSEIAIINIKKLIKKIMERKNFNNSNISMEISQLNNLINQINENKKSKKILNSNKIKLLNNLKKELEKNNDLSELINYINILIDSNNFNKLDYLYAFLFNAFDKKYIKPFLRNTFLIDINEYIKKQFLFMKIFIENIQNIQNEPNSNKKNKIFNINFDEYVELEVENNGNE